MPLILPQTYTSCLSYRDTQRAIKLTRETFERKLCRALNLERVSAPLFVAAGEGINDDLNGVERAVDFDIKSIPDVSAQIVHSLAKWKRLGLRHYGFGVGEGLYTNMNAIRRDEDLDNIHSVYVDQWDWEKVISREQRNLDYLSATVKTIVNAIVDTLEDVKTAFPQVTLQLNRDVTFISSQGLEDLFPSLSPKDREAEICKRCGTVFIMQIGDKLKSGVPHDGRAPDYDDWQLNGDILFWNEVLGIPFEISSMGIRVDEQSLGKQLVKAGCPERSSLYYHSELLAGKLPLCIGGGIGQSRLCMLLLQKAHIGEVHASIWPQAMLDACNENNIKIL